MTTSPTTVAVPYYGRAYCRNCARATRWHRIGVENGARPLAVYWSCATCRAQRLQYADCTNVETMCLTIAEEHLRRTGANLDHDELRARLRLEAWRLYVGWQPERNPSFQSYAFGLLRRRAHDIHRETLGRSGRKPLANAVSLDALDEEVIASLDVGGGDPAERDLDFELFMRGSTAIELATSLPHAPKG